VTSATSPNVGISLKGMLSRRAALLGAAASAAFGLATRTLTASADQVTPATFVLVPGAWAGAWIWRDIITLLRADGHHVYATSTTGMGDRVHLADPAINLDTHITDVVNTIEFEDLHDVHLVGWSYSGMIITGVADKIPERLAQVIYLDADVPANGESGYDAELYSAEARAADVASGIEAGLPGFFTVEPYREWIEAMVPEPAHRAWLFTYFTPQSLATYTQPIQLGIKDLESNPAADALPRAFIFCTEGKGTPDVDALVRTANRVRGNPSWKYRELAETHFAPINNPEATVQALLSLI
jgi:pimeloyl-ACP methyl ester carboxylesterase